VVSNEATDSESTALPAPAGPVRESERIAAIDVLRGFAILGILVVNIQSFSMPDAVIFNPTAYGDLSGMNRWVWIFTHIFFDQKFMTIFSMLFGAGILLMTQRAEDRGIASAPLNRRRMLALLGFGLMHAYLVWHGDILVWYALCGLVVYRFRNNEARSLIVLGLCMVAVASLASIFFGWSMRWWPPDSIADLTQSFKPTSEKIAENLAAFRGGWMRETVYRAPISFQSQTFVFAIWGIWRAGGLMLVGMGLFKLGVLRAARSARFYALLAAAGALVGIPAIVYGTRANFAAGWDIRYSFFFGAQYNYWGSIAASLAWVGLVMLVCKKGILTAVTSRLAAVGRTAFTNYLAQSLICTAVFYGFGLGLYGSVERTGQVLIVLAVWAVQLVVSPLWLRRFRFGPFEWAWRSITYGKRQPMRRT
jgi:uncharacterized protein